MADLLLADLERAKQAREFARSAIPCPCCGAAVVVYTTGGRIVDDFVAGIRNGGGEIHLVSAEHAEELMRTGDWHETRRGGL